jgi:hypothetical protein
MVAKALLVAADLPAISESPMIFNPIPIPFRAFSRGSVRVLDSRGRSTEASADGAGLAASGMTAGGGDSILGHWTSASL